MILWISALAYLLAGFAVSLGFAYIWVRDMGYAPDHMQKLGCALLWPFALLLWALVWIIAGLGRAYAFVEAAARNK